MLSRCTSSTLRRTAGFTLVELVMVIVLIGALSALGIGLFTSRSAFSPLLASQQLSSAVLLAQQAALAGNTTMHTVIISQTADTFTFNVGGVTQFQIDRAGTALTLGGNPPPFVVMFNAQGFPSNGAQHQFSFTGDSNYLVCISSLGAVYQGVC
ncbi:pilus assembly FimT family protein [Marinobacter fonticola]|uniref:pilus assembly FimT family protein n=1 Tax=Marinobacter fonticola TaxID=2603215 RepID=UPI0011E78C74|nr:type II secretion system protein [Marinobacter fonticola]